MRACKICNRILEDGMFYRNQHYKNKAGEIVSYRKKVCKNCKGVKKARITEHPRPIVIKEKWLDVNTPNFIKQMTKKDSFGAIDCLKLVHHFTNEFGIVYTQFTMEDELCYMWGKLLEKNKKIVNEF